MWGGGFNGDADNKNYDDDADYDDVNDKGDDDDDYDDVNDNDDDDDWGCGGRVWAQGVGPPEHPTASNSDGLTASRVPSSPLRANVDGDCFGFEIERIVFVSRAVPSRALRAQ